MSTKQWNVQEQLQSLGSDQEGSPFLAINAPLDEAQKSRKWVQARKLIQTDDWWSVWIGFSLFGVALGVAAIKKTYPDFQPGILPALWSGEDPSTMFSLSNGIGFLILVILSFGFALLQFFFVQKGKPVEKQVKLKYYAPGFLLLELISVGIQVISANKLLDKYGLKEEIWAFIVGIILGNLLSFVNDKNIVKKCLTPAASAGEFYIKIGLVLLGVDITSFGSLTLRAIVVSWPMTIIEIVLIYASAIYFFNFENHELLLMLAAGTVICGASAATSIKESISGSQQDLALVISILTTFTIVQMIAIPYAAKAIGIPLEVGAAWMGATIDSTGSVVAAAQIFGGAEAIVIASSVKIVQNSLIGFIAIGAAIYWAAYKVEQSDDEDDFEVKPKTSTCSGKRLLMLWETFPKFILGFLIISGCLTIVGNFPRENHDKIWADNVTLLVKSTSRWFFTLGFLGIGWSANFKSLSSNLEIGKPVLVYVIGQMWDLALKLGMAYVVFGLKLF